MRLPILFRLHIIVLLALVAMMPAAFAASSGDYYKVDDSYDQSRQTTPAVPANEVLSVEQWLERMRDLSRTGPGRFYFGLRGGYQFENDYDGRANVSGYSGPPDDSIDFTDALADAGRWTATSEAEGFVSMQLGYTWFLPALRGRARVEAEASYNIHETELCTRSIPATSAARAAARVAISAPATEEKINPAFRALVDGNQTCRTYDEPVYTFLGNIFYDITFSGRSLATLQSGVRPGVHFILGAGAGYALNENDIPRTIIAADAIEPKINDSTDTTFSYASDADNNALDTTAQPADAAKSGFLLPAYAGLGYSLEYITGEAILFEVLYRYNILAPDGFGEHGVSAGIRYRF